MPDARPHARPARRRRRPSARSSRCSCRALERVLARVEAVESLGKFSGATGTFAAHVAADAGRRLAGDLARVRDLARPRLEPAHHPDRIARLAGRAVLARSATLNRILHNLCTDIWTYISMGYLTPDPAGGGDRIVDDAAQDQPDPVRERRGQPRAVDAPCSTRSRRPSSPAACSATSPTRRPSATSASRSVTPCSRSTTSPAASARSRSTRRRPRRRPRRQLGGARRGDPDRDPRRGDRRAQLDRRPVRAAQGADARQAGRAEGAARRSSRGSTSAPTPRRGCSRSPRHLRRVSPSAGRRTGRPLDLVTRARWRRECPVVAVVVVALRATPRAAASRTRRATR